MRILFCETNIDGTIGGSYYSLLYLVKGLDRSRYHTTVLFYAEHALMEAFREAADEVVVWRRGRAWSFIRPQHPLGGWLGSVMLVPQKLVNFLRGYVWATLARARFLKARRVHLVHLNNSIKYNHDWMVAARLARARCVSHERGINDSYSAAARYLARRLDAVICISEAVAENMRRRGAGFENLTTIHNGLDPDTMKVAVERDALRERFGIDPAAPVVVMVGNIRRWKGQETVVRAIAEVHRRFRSVRCVFVGDTSPADREYERSVRALVKDLGLEDGVIFTGFQPNVADFLMMSDIVVHASVDPEPFGRVILEAMACRKPVIGARGGAITELVVDGETGLTYPPGDAGALASAISSLVGTPEDALRLGRNGYERLVSRFHIRRNVEATMRLYERVVGARS